MAVPTRDTIDFTSTVSELRNLRDLLRTEESRLEAVLESIGNDSSEDLELTVYTIKGETLVTRKSLARFTIRAEIQRIDNLLQDINVTIDNRSSVAGAQTTSSSNTSTTSTTSSESTDGTVVDEASSSTEDITSEYSGAESSYDAPIADHNVPSVKDAYFGQTVRLLGQDRRFAGNQPQSIERAVDLFTGARSNKGMIVSHFVGGLDEDTNASAALKKYAFLFHYNPTVISMGMSTSANIDPYLYAQQPPAISPAFGNYSSSISFSLMLNRIPDMQFYSPSGQLQIQGNIGGDAAQKLYGGKFPSPSEQRRIFNYGTMYDIEWLLKTITGIELETELRGKTSDLGFLVGKLVELHLGNKLRYLVFIDGISVEHVIFDERMVPVLTNVNITCGRVPDLKTAYTDTASEEVN